MTYDGRWDRLVSVFTGSTRYLDVEHNQYCGMCREGIVPLDFDHVLAHVTEHFESDLGSQLHPFESFLSIRLADGSNWWSESRAAIQDFFGFDRCDVGAQRAFWTRMRRERK